MVKSFSMWGMMRRINLAWGMMRSLSKLVLAAGPIQSLSRLIAYKPFTHERTAKEWHLNRSTKMQIKTVMAALRKDPFYKSSIVIPTGDQPIGRPVGALS